MTNAEFDYGSEQNAITQSVGTDNVLSVARLLEEGTYPESSSFNSRTNAKSEAPATSEIVFTDPYENRSNPSENSARPSEAFSILSPKDLLAALRSAPVPPETTTRERLIGQAEQHQKLALKNNEDVRVKTGLDKDYLDKNGFSDKKVNERLERDKAAIEQLTDADLKNIDAFLAAARNNDVKAMGEIVSKYKDNPDHFARSIQLGIRLEADNRYGDGNILYSSQSNMIGVPVSKGGHRTFFHPNGTTTTDVYKAIK